MMKKIILFCLIFLLSAPLCNAKELLLEYDGKTHTYTGNIYKLLVDGNEVNTPLEPIIFNDRALVPVREVFEATGAVVNYNSATKGIYIEGNGIKLIMNIGSTSVSINGNLTSFTDGVTPMLIAKKGEDAKTMVPVRFISEKLGYDVDFSANKINIITSKITSTPISKATLNGIYCNRVGDFVMISVKSNDVLSKVTNPILTSSGVLYVDIYNSEGSLPSNISVEKGAVKSIRTGTHDDYIRIALDTTNLKNYSMKLSSDKKTIMITTEKISTSTSETEKIVVIDAGHGGSDGGAGRDYNGNYIKEKDINLAVAKKTAEILRSNNIHVEMTRTGDTYPELSERSAFANELNAAIFVSIHSNSASAEEANGIEVFYASTNNGDSYGIKSQELANQILKAMIANTNANNRKVKTESHVVTRTSDMPAALVEIGFITNNTELANLLNSDYQDKLASGIAEGIMKCLPKITIPANNNSVNFSETDLGTKIG